MAEAKRWLNFIEKGGNNKGEIVEMFQRAVDNKAEGEPWCASFTQYCIKQVDILAKELMATNGRESEIFKSEHCWTMWVNSPPECKRNIPQFGFIAIWRHTMGTNGHCGIVVGVDSESQEFTTIEGNTSPNNRGSQREGDGVFMKKRGSIIGDLQLIGFLNPWPDLG